MSKKKPEALNAYVDRIEERMAVIVLADDDEVSFDLPLKYLPRGIKEGDYLRIGIEPAPDETEEARQRIEKLQKELAAENDPDQTNFKL